MIGKANKVDNARNIMYFYELAKNYRLWELEDILNAISLDYYYK